MMQRIITMHRRQNSDVVTDRRLTEMLACQACGCRCGGRLVNDLECNLDLHRQIGQLESQLMKSHSHITSIQQDLVFVKEASEMEINKLQDELAKIRDRYDRLLDSHKRIQKLNHGLEDKLLKVVNTFEAEKTGLQKELATLTSKLVDAKATICELEEENLPFDLQERVKSQMTHQQIISMEEPPVVKETKLIRVPMPTFPPTAMVYSVNNEDKNGENSQNVQTVPMTLIAKVLTQPNPKRKAHRTYICPKCRRDVIFADKEVQANLLKETEGNSDPKVPRVHRLFGRTRSNSSTETEI
ncbi:hypothetical protein CHS0354_038089 [Potamilus streckersoni]|uniref:Uncharacterized protein n=1 Tax=Potamilus streckersoni TaxID=2493646 RepID=A0AAE0ST25_9BIVA|nr:hypothetical protein CHS0354_038089 [Potamilus streckersoni]